MKKVFLLFIFLLISSTFCFALTLDDNGYGWVAATSKEKEAAGKELSKTNGKDSAYWVDMLDGFYSINNWNIMSLKIKKVADQIALPEQSPGIKERGMK
jgi:hypothetical protein